MKFSIIIPAYNEEKYVASAIQSVLRQNFSREDYEIIVVDNNSVDNTVLVAKKAGADLVVTELEHGTNMARNRGYKESSGEIIIFFDADCEAPPDWLARIEKYFRDPAVVALSGPYDQGFKGVKGFLDRIYTRALLPRIPGILKALFGRSTGIIIEGNVAIRGEALRKIGGLPLVPYFGDGVLTALPLSRVGKMIFDSDLRVRSSPRRFEKQGFLYLAYLFAKAYLKAYFTASKK